MIDLKDLSRKELEKLRSSVEAALERLEETERKLALAAAEKVAKAHGYTLTELTTTGGAAKGKRAPRASKGKTPPKYRNPANETETWSGRGRQPAWFKAALAAGKTPDDMAI